MTRFQNFLLAGATMLGMAACSSNNPKTINGEKFSAIKIKSAQQEQMENIDNLQNEQEENIAALENIQKEKINEFNNAMGLLFDNKNSEVSKEQLVKLVNDFNEENNDQHIVTLRDESNFVHRLQNVGYYHLDMTSPDSAQGHIIVHKSTFSRMYTTN